MERLVRGVAWLMGAYGRAKERRWRFLGLFLLFFFVTLLILSALGIVPDSAPATAVEAPRASTESEAPATPEFPARVSIPAIGLSATIANPDTTDIEALDALLLSGAVRYPTSARLGEDGNVVLFGHSSYLPVVGNPAYKTFNDIQKLAQGDTITLYSSHTQYVYRVKSVSKANANDAVIPLSVSGRILTLSTCDSFASKSDRFVVVADFVGSQAISS